MLKKNVDAVTVLFVAAVVCLSLCSISCSPVFRRSQLQQDLDDVRDLLELYKQSHQPESFSNRNKRNPTIGPDLGYGNRWHAGYTVAHLQQLKHQLTGPNSPGKRSVAIYGWKK
ncbi:uncharacterized protein [Mytilus edulis]|uniref:uncharacterized protein n=1 Tax=Mytilus edulis TaxID=6550 RepID=UPI0039EFF3CC